MNVNVHAYLRGAAGNTERKICAFRSNAAKGRHYIEIARQIAAEFLGDSFRHVSNVGCFRLVEARRSNEVGDPAHASRLTFWGVGATLNSLIAAGSETSSSVRTEITQAAS